MVLADKHDRVAGFEPDEAEPQVGVYSKEELILYDNSEWFIPDKVSREVPNAVSWVPD